MNEKLIKQMVDKFLNWKLPEKFSPDCGISFTREINGHKFEPTGTNLFTAEQAKQMFEYILKDIEEIK